MLIVSIFHRGTPNLPSTFDDPNFLPTSESGARCGPTVVTENQPATILETEEEFGVLFRLVANGGSTHCAYGTRS